MPFLIYSSFYASALLGMFSQFVRSFLPSIFNGYRLLMQPCLAGEEWGAKRQRFVGGNLQGGANKASGRCARGSAQEL